MHQALERLKDFRLSDAKCHSETDRKALLDLIADWWTDKTSGETDPERLRALGHHRFESYVRYELAPKLLSGDAKTALPLRGRVICCYVGFWPFMLDGLAQPSVNAWDTFAMVPWFLLMVIFLIPAQMAIYDSMARGVTWLRGRGYSKAVAVALALVMVVPATIVIQGSVLVVPFPNQIADPGWEHDDDGLSETGRKNLKWQVLMTASAVAVLATNAVFK